MRTQFIIFLIAALTLLASSQDLSEAQISEKLERAKAAQNDPQATESVPLWEAALASSKTAASSRAAAQAFEARQARLKNLPELKVPTALPGADSLEETSAFLGAVDAQIEETQKRIKEIEEQGTGAAKRTATLVESIATVESQLAELQVPVEGKTLLEEARVQKALQERKQLEAQLAELKAEQELIRRQSETYTERIQRRKAHLGELKNLRQEVAAKVEQLKAEKIKKNKQVIASLDEEFAKVPSLSAIVEEVRGFREKRDEIQAELKQAQAYKTRMSEMRATIQDQYDSAQRRINLLESANLDIDDETGVSLRRQRSRLPSNDEISSQLSDQVEKAAQAEIDFMDVTDRIKALPLFGEKDINRVISEHPRITRDRIDELLKQRLEIQRDLREDYSNLKLELEEGIEEARNTISEIQGYSNFIDERLLWIKSTKPLHWSEPVDEWQRVVGLFGAAGLGQVLASLKAEWTSHLPLLVIALLFVLGVLLKQGTLRRVMRDASQTAVRRNCTSIVPTLKFIGAAVVLSAWLSVIPWALSVVIDGPSFWQVALVRLATFLFVASLLLKFAKPDGLFVSHFRVAPEPVATFRRHLQWFSYIAPVFVFLVPALTLFEENTESGRLTFVAAMLVVAVFGHAILLPKRSILKPADGATIFTKIVYALAILIPLVLLIGSALGYFASVLTVRDQIGATISLLVLAFIVIRFLTRWTLVSRRKLAITQALRRREAMVAQREKEEAGESDAGSEELRSLEEVKSEAVDVVEVEEQTKQLVKVLTYGAVILGLWGIWNSTLPALKVLDRVQLWESGTPTTSEKASTPSVPGMSVMTPEAEAEEETAAPVNKVKEAIVADDGRITLQDLLLSIVFLVLTFVAARNIPSLLSLTLFSRIQLGPGGNFALTTTVRYLIVMIGIVLALAQIGVTWGKVQWLAAAVTLGIGFGLQEIFANFVAGIILLFERPIRLGDIVTVGDISGKVTQIRIRATTIQQFNNRELLVPNKEFITSQLVNWTLKDSVLRFEVPVGIAYGSDTEKATRILQEIVDSHERVMKDPAPSVLFTSFGNSTLDFLVRGFVPSADYLLSTQSELHYAIDQAFRDAEIEIAFPQQDLHIRSLPEGVKLTTD